MGIKITIHATSTGVCALSGREAEGLTVTFEDGTLQNTFLSWKSFRQLAALKFGQTSAGKAPAAPPLPPATPKT
ncbi:MAG: hypothetical protein L0Z62_23075 [Gemmataceae bacterium]|nr:hypothetical protein [Gemmataceae bacterium]